PAHCLIRVRWKPKLPLEQAAAAQQLQYSRIMKTAVLFNKRFWSNYKGYGFSTFTTRISDFCFDSTYGQRGTEGILCSYSIGDKADDLSSEPSKANVKTWIRDDMVSVSRTKERQIVAIDVKSQPWQKVSWIGGAYAFYRPGQWFTVRPALQRAHGRVLFAGEHLADLQGFMEGACVAAGHPPARRGFSSADCLVHERTGQPHYQTFALQGRTRAGACNCSDNYSASGRYPWLEAAWARVQISLFPQPFRQCSAVACGSAVASTSRYPFHCAYRKLHSAFNQRNATLLHPDRLVSAPSVSAS